MKEQRYYYETLNNSVRRKNNDELISSLKNGVKITKKSDIVKKETIVISIPKKVLKEYLMKAVSIGVLVASTSVVVNSVGKEIAFKKYLLDNDDTYINNQTTYIIHNDDSLTSSPTYTAYRIDKISQIFLNSVMNANSKKEVDLLLYNLYYQLDYDAPGNTSKVLNYCYDNRENIRNAWESKGISNEEISELLDCIQKGDSSYKTYITMSGFKTVSGHENNVKNEMMR